MLPAAIATLATILREDVDLFKCTPCYAAPCETSRLLWVPAFQESVSKLDYSSKLTVRYLWFNKTKTSVFVVNKIYTLALTMLSPHKMASEYRHAHFQILRYRNSYFGRLFKVVALSADFSAY